MPSQLTSSAELHTNMRKALFAASNYWTSPLQVGSHMLARKLANNGWKLAFISHPLSPLHYLKDWKSSDYRSRFAMYAAGGVEDCAGMVWAYVPFTLVPPHKYPITRSEWVLSNWQNLTIPRLVEKVKNAGFGKVDLLYFDNPLQNFWLNEIQHGVSIYRMSDNATAFDKSTKSVHANELKLCQSVTHVLCTARSLISRAVHMGARDVRYFPNGVDLSHFREDHRGKPTAYAHIPSPRVVYVGEMTERFDFQLVRHLSIAFPEVSFVLIGPSVRAEQEFKACPNVYTLGPIPYADLPPYIRHADVGLIPFALSRKADLIEGVNPLKMYQYLAAGIPVVSVAWPELESMGAPVHLCQNEREFVTALRAALHDGLDKRAAATFLADKDWQNRVAELERLVSV